MNDRSRPQRFRAWGRRQLYSFFSSLGSLANNAVGTLMTVAVLGIAMALPLALYVAVDNLEAVDLKTERWGSLSVYLVESANEADAQSVATLLQGRYAAQVEVVSPDEGLASFREASGFGAVLDLLDGNPLPWVLHVTPAEAGEAGLEARVSELAAWIEAQEAVEFGVGRTLAVELEEPGVAAGLVVDLVGEPADPPVVLLGDLAPVLRQDLLDPVHTGLHFTLGRLRLEDEDKLVLLHWLHLPSVRTTRVPIRVRDLQRPVRRQPG